MAQFTDSQRKELAALGFTIFVSSAYRQTHESVAITDSGSYRVITYKGERRMRYMADFDKAIKQVKKYGKVLKYS